MPRRQPRREEAIPTGGPPTAEERSKRALPVAERPGYPLSRFQAMQQIPYIQRGVTMTARRSTWFVLSSLSFMAVGFALHANPKDSSAPAAKPQVKGAVLNLSYVIKNWKKWKEFQEEYKKKLEGYDDQLKSMKKARDDKDQLARNTADAAAREALIEEMDNLSKRMKEITDEGKKTLEEIESKQFADVYKAVTDAAARHAKAHGIEVVMHYNDGTNEDEINNPKNVARKLGQGALFPIYLAPGVDISKELVAALNEEYDRPK
jgi:Skp family chaperone for outer membrane proteins